MQSRVTHRIYGLPLVLFVFLSILFVSAGVYLDKEDKRVRISKAQSVAEQVKISLEVFSTERIQAVHNLMRNWPTFAPNQVDWFNAQAMSLMGMQRGYSSLTFADQNGIIQWVATPSHGMKTRLSNQLIGQPLVSVGLTIPALAESLASTLVHSSVTSHYHIIVGRSISPQELNHGYLLAGFDAQTILGVMLGELEGPQFNFVLRDSGHTLFSNGELVNDGTVITTEPFSFIGRQFSLSMQTQVGRYSVGLLVAVIGLLMSALASWIFHKQMKGAVNLSVSQKRYLTASEASLDALVIYRPKGSDYELVEANRYSRFLFRGACSELSTKTLKDQLAFLGKAELFDCIKEVATNNMPFEEYVAIKESKIAPEWLKVQVVKAGDNIALTARDVTERFKAQQALKHSEERYRRLVDGMHRHFVYTKTAEHKFIYVSAGINTILGFTPEYFIEKESRLLRKIPDETFDIRMKSGEGVKPDPYLVHYTSCEGKELVLEFSDTPILNESGALIAVEGIAKDVTKEQALQEEVAYQANHDQLTGLLNRYAFDKQLRDILEANAADTPDKNTDVERDNVTTIYPSRNSDDSTNPGVMCFIDMDRFKLVNDSCGHPAGDKLLQEVSTIFRQHISEKDLLARIGGDEFCIIYHEQPLDKVKIKLDKLLKAISTYRFMYGDKLFFVGASIGVIEMNPQEHNAAELIKAADNACYKAKHLGRNRYFVYHAHDAQLNMDNSENDVLHTLHKALQFDGFELYSQAIMPLNGITEDDTNGLEHYEILLRLTGSDGTLISPGLFIPLAERHGLMNKVDYWVVDNTLKTLEANPLHVDNVAKVAINLSGITLGDEITLLKITQRLQGTTVPLEKICFEITETTAVTNLSAAKHFISTLREIGCSFALDDFGAGMSSFTYLKNLDVDYVKIDGSFVRNIVHDPIDHATVTAINNIAHSMGKQTVAEFVVDTATANVLKALQVDYGQGFALDKPKPLAHRVQWLTKLVSV
ncbi:EAL and GGDEF domain-containing protein [Alteromonas lipotrueae]|uniref:sensor domain-containing protein n=1 Tax=Alteromonas lipotrueae TaxID=2803814 RepID=UPI001C47F69E|nr:bifunctional diguanylate cyclase/phosphodiesterase [Alteromonas lipotrueae]